MALNWCYWIGFVLLSGSETYRLQTRMGEARDDVTDGEYGQQISIGTDGRRGRREDDEEEKHIGEDGQRCCWDDGYQVERSLVHPRVHWSDHLTAENDHDF